MAYQVAGSLLSNEKPDQALNDASSAGLSHQLGRFLDKLFQVQLDQGAAGIPLVTARAISVPDAR